METNNSYGLYVHIPFCVSKCAYCDFASIAKNDTVINEYTKALCKEIKMHKAEFEDILFDTVFIGGGTPSCIPEDNLSKIITCIYDNFNIETKEFTIEINPGTGNAKLFKSLYKLGVNRASVGLQCANDEILKSVGRIHNIEQFIGTVNQIKSAGIDNFSADIISGLPNQTTEDIIKSVDLISSLDAKHISMYTLKLEKNTPLEIAVKNNKITLPTTDEECAMSKAAREHLESLGYKRYEISNFAKPNFESQHNLKYWNRVPYLGVGVAAASMYNDYRYCNTPSVQDYISAINNNAIPLVENTKLSDDEIAFEIIMLATRLSKGMEYAVYNQITGLDFKEKYTDILEEMQKENLIKKSNTHLALTQKGMNLQNNVLLKFMD